jgi:hypothetical protein
MGNTLGATRDRGRVLFVVGFVLGGVGLGTTPAAAQDQPAPPPVVVGTNGANGYVSVEATSPGSGGGPSSPSAGSGGSSSGGGGGLSAPLVNPFGGVGVSDAQYAGAPGFYNQCGPIADPAVAAANPALVAQCLTPPPAVPGQPPAAQAPNPVLVAQSAISQLNLKASAPRLSAVDHTAVGLPVWMWVDGGAAAIGPLTATATAGATTVTATATLDRIVWSMGPAGATVICRGPGTPVAVGTPLYAGQNSPTCGYSYQLRSLPDRTGGTGRWPVTATSVWTITWSGGGQTGGQELPLTAGTDLEVGELQAVITGGS